MPQMSFITAAFNAKAHIGHAVRSVLAMKAGDWEMLIVADDGENYEQVLAAECIRDRRIRHLRTDMPGSGPAIARNIGAAAAQSDIIANLDADDSVSGNYMSLMLPVVKAYGAATPSILVTDAVRGAIIPTVAPPAGQKTLRLADMMTSRPTYAPIAYDRSEGFTWPELYYGEDMIFWCMILERLGGIGYEPRAQYRYSFKKGSLSRPDEPTTHALCERRRKMIEWIRINSPLTSDFLLLIEWLESCNDMEELFGYQLVEIEQYQHEVKRRLEKIMGKRAAP